jgi:hypothetical protein
MTAMRPHHLAAAQRPWLTLAAILLAACDGATKPEGPLPPRGIVVLNGGAPTGLTLTADTGGTIARIPFEPEFDGGTIRLENDTVLTTSSSYGTNKLYVADLRTGALREVEMPQSANAAGATPARGFRGAAFAVALRSRQTLGLIALTGPTTATTTELAGVGRCPYDVVRHGADLWVVDYNAKCEEFYQLVGDSRLIRVPAAGDTRDTIALPGVKFATKAIVVADTAYVASIGVADYSQWPAVTFVSPGRVTKVDLRARQVLATLSMPAGTNDADLSLGQDGRLYVSAYTNASTTDSRPRAFAIDPRTMQFVGERASGAQYLALTKAAGGTPDCRGVAADALGRLYCTERGVGGASTLYVFDLNAHGAELRHFAVGQQGDDVALR